MYTFVYKIMRIIYRCCLFFSSLVIFIFFLPVAIFSRLKRIKKIRPALPKNVFIGFFEIAGFVANFAEILRKNNIYVRVCLTQKNDFFTDDSVVPWYDKGHFQLLKRKFFLFPHFFWSIWHADQVWFMGTSSFFANNADYILLKIAKVDVVIRFYGDDVRCRHLHNAIFSKYSPATNYSCIVNNESLDLAYKLIHHLKAELFAKVISRRDQSTFQFGKARYLPVYQKQLLSQPKKANFFPRLLHAPSDRLVKRTDLVLEAIELLKRKNYNFEFFLLENKKNVEILRVLQYCDIVIDQPSAWTGRLGIEGAASSCAIITGNNFSFMASPKAPFLPFENDSKKLSASIELLLSDHDLLSRTMHNSWKYWYIHHSENAFMQNFKQIWDDTYPVFYPLKDQKQLIQSAAKNLFEYFFIKFFYHPRYK